MNVAEYERSPLVSLTHLTVEIASGPGSKVFRPIEFLIDSGAKFSVVPRADLEALGIPPLGKEIFHITAGHSIEREFSSAIFRYRGRVGGSVVVFGDKGDLTLLGAHTLEALNLGLNPVSRELIELEPIL